MMIGSRPVSSFRGLIGVAREDITPPVGIYAKCWAAATHETAEGVHRPLTLTCITFQSIQDEPPLVLISADLMSWRSREDESATRAAALEALSIDQSRLMFCFTHTHAAPSLRSDDEPSPGGNLIAPYRAHVRDSAIRAARRALARRQAAVLTWRYGACDLASNREFPEPGGPRILCGFNPDTAADDTLLVGRITDDAGGALATIVNYACHPTTLAWENRLISPDYVGAMREIVESQTGGAPCLFLQGASGELAPAEQYSGDPALADRHGRRVGFAVTSVLDSMLAPGKELAFDRVVESGAALAVWLQRDSPVSTELSAVVRQIEMPLKQMPSMADLQKQWEACTDPTLKERLSRRRAIRAIVGDGTTATMPLWIWRVGDTFLLGQPNEAYSLFQRRLRERFPAHAIAVMNLVNGSAGYLPPQESYAKEVYSVSQTPFAQGSLETLISAAIESVEKLA